MNKQAILIVLTALMAVLCINLVGAATYYVDINNAKCDDAYTKIQTQNAGTPWCTFTKGLSNIQSGDTLYIKDGIYTNTNGYVFEDKTLSAKTKIMAYSGSHPVFTSRIPEFDKAPNNKWTKVSAGLWSAIYSSSEMADSWVAAYTGTGVSLFSYTSPDGLKNTLNPEGIFFDDANNKLYLRLKNLNANPNNIALSISNTPILYINRVSGAELELSGFALLFGKRGVLITDSANITLTNNIVQGGQIGVAVKTSNNINIRNNDISMIRSSEWCWEDAKSSVMETSAVWLENDFDGMDVSNNYIYGYFNGVVAYSHGSDGGSKFEDLQIQGNTIYDIMDDAIEIEDYCFGAQINHNKLSGNYKGISLTPALVTMSKPCNISDNLIIANRTQWISGSTFYAGDCFHMDSNNAIKNYIFTRNTCIGRGVWSGMSKINTQNNIKWKDNIFYSQDEKLLNKAGLASKGVLYDYNLYWREDSGAIFQYWNSDVDDATFSTLNSAKSSNLWDGAWDVHSKQANPLFDANYKPKSGSPACTMSSTGSYVGAIPCSTTPPPAAFCGDKVCNGKENCSSCSGDCGSCPPPAPFCGDKVCNGKENCSTCSADCGSCPVVPFCGDNTCNGNENCSSCSRDCGSCPVQDSTITGCTLDDQPWNENMLIKAAFDLNACFNDPLKTQLSFRARGNRSIIISIRSGIVDLSAPVNWTGVEHVVFYAYSGNRSASTNNITLTVNHVPVCGDSVCEEGEACDSCSSDCGACPVPDPPARYSGGGGGGGSISNSNLLPAATKPGAAEVEPEPAAVFQSVKENKSLEENKSVQENTLSNNQETVPEQISEVKPEMPAAGSVVKGLPPRTPVQGFVILSLIGATLFILYGGDRGLKKREATVVSSAVSSKPDYSDYSELHNYVGLAISNGHGCDSIASELLDAGWPEEVVKKIINLHHDDLAVKRLEALGLESSVGESLYAYLADALQKGFSTQQITDDLLGAGWNEEVISSLLNAYEQDAPQP